MYLSMFVNSVKMYHNFQVKGFLSWQSARVVIQFIVKKTATKLLNCEGKYTF
jgi:hypothetical protein